MGKYFTIEELCESEKANELKIENTPNEQQTKNLEELIKVIDGIREAWTQLCRKNKWGSAAIQTNSGFRNNELNKAVGGSKTSAHLLGYAIDFEPVNQRNLEFYNFCIDYLKTNNIAWDQLINEKPRCQKPSWIHLGLKNSKGQQRRQIFTKV